MISCLNDCRHNAHFPKLSYSTEGLLTFLNISEACVFLQFAKPLVITQNFLRQKCIYWFEPRSSNLNWLWAKHSDAKMKCAVAANKPLGRWKILKNSFFHNVVLFLTPLFSFEGMGASIRVIDCWRTSQTLGCWTKATSEAWHRFIWPPKRATPRWCSCCCAKELSFTGKVKDVHAQKISYLGMQWSPIGYCVFFAVITGVGLVCTTLPMKDTPKLWRFSCQPIPSYWIK